MSQPDADTPAHVHVGITLTCCTGRLAARTTRVGQSTNHAVTSCHYSEHHVTSEKRSLAEYRFLFGAV